MKISIGFWTLYLSRFKLNNQKLIPNKIKIANYYIITRMKASAIILKRKVVRYEGSDENPGELSKHHSVKSAIDLEDLNPVTSRVVLPSDSRCARFFKPGEASLTENELLKRKEKKFRSHRFYL